MLETCPQCLKNPKWIEEDGRVREYCGKTCARKAGALLEDTGTISLLNPQPISLPDPRSFELVDHHQPHLQLDS